MNTMHKQIRVCIGDREADIDEGIAPLIEELWKADIETFNSCQENKPGIIWIQFASPEDASRSLDIVAQYEDGVDTLYNRARIAWAPFDDKDMTAPFWEYAILPEDMAMVEEYDENEDLIEESHMGKPCFTFSVSIRFPVADYAVILERMT